MPRRALASRYSGSNTTVESCPPPRLLCRGMPNFCVKSLFMRAMTFNVKVSAMAYFSAPGSSEVQWGQRVASSGITLRQ